MSGIGSVGGASSAYPLPEGSSSAQALREGIAQFSKAIGGHPGSSEDVDALGASIINLNQLTSG